MEAEVLSFLEVKAVLGNGIVGVKVNSDERQDLVARFGVSALPTDVFVSADGTVLSRSVGSPGREGYLAKLTQFRVTNPAPASSPEPQTTVVVQAADTKVESVTAAKPVFAELNTPEKSIVGLSNTKSEVKTGGTTSPSETDTAKSPSVLPLAMNRALRKVAGLRLGLSGYSPVTLTVATKWQMGNPQFTYSFQGVRYQLSSAEELEEFKASPERFVPALHGCDPVFHVKDKIAESGFVELGATFRSRMYFFATKASRQEFLKTPEKFATADHPAYFEHVQAASSDPAAKPTSTKSAASTDAE
jgi:YHS domain-containing protein